MRSGCEPDVSGANDPAPAEDVLNENPSLVALGKNLTNKTKMSKTHDKTTKQKLPEKNSRTKPGKKTIIH